MNKLPKTIAIYGFGRAGRSLATSITRFTDFEIIVYSTKEHNEQPQVRCTRDVEEFFNLIRIRQSEMLFIAASDDAIAGLVDQISHVSWLPSLVAHLSGVLSGSVLSPLSQKTSIAQFHPLVSLDGVSEIPVKSFVAVSSESEKAREILTKLALDIQCSPATIKEGDQALYHAAAVLTGNLSLGLVSMSLKMLEQCGIESDQARIALARLLKSAAVAVENGPLISALTGPLARGDVQTIEKHQVALQKVGSMKDVRDVYSLLAKELLPKLVLSESTKEEIRRALRRDAC